MEKIYIKYEPYNDEQLKEACKIMEEMGYHLYKHQVHNEYGILHGDKDGDYYIIIDDSNIHNYKLIKDLTKEELKIGDTIEVTNHNSLRYTQQGQIIQIYGNSYDIMFDNGKVKSFDKKDLELVYLDGMDNTDEHEEDESINTEKQSDCDSSIKDNYIEVKNGEEAIIAINYFKESGYENFNKDLELIIKVIEDFELMSIYITNYGNIDYTYNIENLMKTNLGYFRSGLKKHYIIDGNIVSGNLQTSNIDYLDKDEHIKAHHYCRSIYANTEYIDTIEGYGYALNNLTNKNNTMENLNIETETLELETNEYFENKKTQKEIIKVKNYLEAKENNLSTARRDLQCKEYRVEEAKESLVNAANNKNMSVVKDILKQFKADKEFLDNFIKTKVEDFKDDEVVEEEYNPEHKWN